MSYSFRVARPILAVSASLLLALVIGAVIAQLALPGRIERRLEAALAGREEVRGGVEGIRVCVPCGSYTLVAPEISARSDGAWRPAFSAREVVVSLLPASLLRGRPAGAVSVEAPSFHFLAGKGSQDTSWEAIGEALLPVPLDRLAIRHGRVDLANRALDPPVHLRLTDVELSASNLTRRAAGPIEVEAEGRLGRQGRVQVRLRFPDGPRRLELETTLRAIPVRDLNSLLRNAVGVDVAAGSLDADGEVSADAEGRLEGVLSCRVSDLDILQMEDVSDGDPLDLLWESFAAASVTAGSDAGGSFGFDLEIEETVADPSVSAWPLLQRLVRRSLWALLESPGRAARWLAQRAVPLRS